MITCSFLSGLFQFNWLCDKLKRRKHYHCQLISSADRVCVQKLFSGNLTETTQRQHSDSGGDGSFGVNEGGGERHVEAEEEDVFLIFANAEEMGGKKN